jgi:TM2 domain-containing membrane protein YozV
MGELKSGGLGLGLGLGLGGVLVLYLLFNYVTLVVGGLFWGQNIPSRTNRVIQSVPQSVPPSLLPRFGVILLRR